LGARSFDTDVFVSLVLNPTYKKQKPPFIAAVFAF
jgi:hypothetical protein